MTVKCTNIQLHYSNNYICKKYNSTKNSNKDFFNNQSAFLLNSKCSDLIQNLADPGDFVSVGDGHGSGNGWRGTGSKGVTGVNQLLVCLQEPDPQPHKLTLKHHCADTCGGSLLGESVTIHVLQKWLFMLVVN